MVAVYTIFLAKVDRS